MLLCPKTLELVEVYGDVESNVSRRRKKMVVEIEGQGRELPSWSMNEN